MKRMRRLWKGTTRSTSNLPDSASTAQPPSPSISYDGAPDRYLSAKIPCDDNRVDVSELADDPRHLQPSPIASSFPPEVLLPIFKHYCWDYAQSYRSPVQDSLDHFCIRTAEQHRTSDELFEATGSKNGFPVIPLPFGAQPILRLSAVCALWRYTLLSSPSAYSAIVVSFRRQEGWYHQTLTELQRTVRGRLNLLRLMLARSDSELLSLAFVADTEEADLWGGDGRMAIAALAHEVGRERARWGELKVLGLNDRPLFNLLFRGHEGAGDDGAWCREDYVPGTTGLHASSDIPVASVEATLVISRRPLPKPALQLQKLVLHLGHIRDERIVQPTSSLPAARIRSLSEKMVGLTYQDIQNFILGMPVAYPALDDFELRVEVLSKDRVGPLLLCMKAFYDTASPGEDSEVDPRWERQKSMEYDAWRTYMVETAHSRFSGVQRLGLHVNISVNRSASGVCPPGLNGDIFYNHHSHVKECPNCCTLGRAL